MKPKPVKKIGHVAYFDILGYRHVDPKIVMKLWDGRTKLQRAMVKQFNPSGSYHVFGDSILLFWPDSPPSNDVFLIVCLILFQSMFMGGLPVRGAIAHGDYFEKGNLWSGQPIVDAHGCAESLGPSACVACPSAKELADQHSGLFSNQSVPISVKGTCEYRREELPVLKFLQSFNRTEIIARFSEHGKATTGKRVEEKIEFTLELMNAAGVTPRHD